VTSPVGDPDSTNNSATDDTTVIEAATLLVTKSDGLATVVAGTIGHAYTITVTNSGPSDADTVVLDDSVPAAFSAGSPGADLGGDCSASVGNTIHCTLPASLSVGATWTITVPYAVAASVAPQAVTNTATAVSDENTGGIAASDLTDVTAAADLGLSASDGLATVTAGDGLSHLYTIIATNGGPSDATTTSLVVSWPSGFTLGTISPSQGSCSPIGAGPDFSCALGTITAGGSATVTVAFSVPAATPGGTQTLTASVTSPVGDPDSTNNSATDDTTVIEAATPTPTAGPTGTPSPGPTANPSSSTPGSGGGLPSTSSGSPSDGLPGADLTLVGVFFAFVFLVSALIIGRTRNSATRSNSRR
jgi:uncharacterized repeat protein (TIGR01451 family)